MYKKILINGPEDLTKEEGEYITNIGFAHWERKPGWYVIDDDYGDNHRVTMEDSIDWYLIESDIIMPSEEEIDSEAKTFELYSDVEQSLFMAGAKWMKSEIERLNNDNTPPKHRTLEDDGYSFETGV